MWFFIISSIIVAILLFKLLFFSNPNKKSYWSQYGIREIDGTPGASIFEILMGKKDPTDRDKYVYDLMGPNEKFCGMKEMGNNLIFLKDLDLIKKVLIKDFDYFVDRRSSVEGMSENSVFRKMLPFLEGEKWKTVRTAISKTFTTGRINQYSYHFNSIGKNWTEMLRKKAENSNGSVVIQVPSTVTQFAADVLASAIFGIDGKTVQNPNSVFGSMAAKVSILNLKLLAFSLFLPRLSRFFGLQPVDKNGVAFFDKLFSDGLKARMRGVSETRNDFVQMMVELKKGELKEDRKEELDTFEKESQISDGINRKTVLTDDVINAQSIFFFIGGFNTVKDFISFVLYAIAVHQDVQDKLREEVRKILKDDGTLDYDDVGKLVYMDMVFCEVIRKFPSALRMERICTKEYKDKESGLFIPKGTLVVIPSNSYHHDKQYFENPDTFDPEHFRLENKAKRNNYAFMPFGFGPRSCLGKRFAMVQAKVAISQIVNRFRVEATQKTPIPMKIVTVSLNRLPPPDLELKFTLLKA